MKSRENAKQKREAEARRRKDLWLPKKEEPAGTVAAPLSPERSVKKNAEVPQQSPEEEARDFLEYLEKYDRPVQKDESPEIVRRKHRSAANICTLNLESGMPAVSEAVQRMRLGFQELRFRRVKTVKLIHGYGSSGQGGRICIGVREELAAMKRKKQIKEFIPGEEFGPMSDASRKLADQYMNISRDPDYGRINHGITIVVL